MLIRLQKKDQQIGWRLRKNWLIHFPQFASMSGIKIEAIEKATTAQELAVAAEWKLTQAKIKMTLNGTARKLLMQKQKNLRLF